MLVIFELLNVNIHKEGGYYNANMRGKHCYSYTSSSRFSSSNTTPI